MSKRTIFITFPILLLIGVYFLGPAPEKPRYDPGMPSVPQSLVELDDYVASQEAKHKLKPDNQARIVWADTSKRKTEYAVIYLHGFSASQEEGDPVHEAFARTFGCNLYLARMADHGVDTTDQLLYFTPDRWWASAKEALAIGKVLGEKVIVMSTSTGGTIALVLAATYPDDVFALVNMSPNIAINDPLAWVANNHWGLQVARLVKGGKYLVSPPPPGVDSVLNDKYWITKYRLEAAAQLEEMIESTMNKSTFEAVKQPTLTLYYYKNEQEQDPTVKVSAMLEMMGQLGTAEELKVAVPIPDGGGHVIGSYIRTKSIENVSKEAQKFAIEKLGMKPVTDGVQTP